VRANVTLHLARERWSRANETRVEHDEHGMLAFGLLVRDGPRERRIALREHPLTEDDGIVEGDVKALLVKLGGSKVLRKHAGRESRA
jgi:hypothetical protein